MKEQKSTNSIFPKNKDFELLRKYFSNFFDKNQNFDFEKFRRELSKNKDIDFSKESYGMDWLGKSYARLLASDEATTLLKEDEEWNNREENKNSENLLIKGDNLEVLKHLSNAYYEKIKMIYIDPPYNTGSDGFVYQDNRKFTVEELSKLAGIEEEKAKRILEFTESKSNSHSAWLTFMYPRLYIAKHLLKDDGVIFVSIDDNEVAQLKLLMDEIFGEENFVGQLIWKKKAGGGNDSEDIATEHEYIVVYRKLLNGIYKIPLKEATLKKYKFKDEKFETHGPYHLKDLNDKSISDSKGLHYDIETPDKTILKGSENQWKCNKETFESRLNDNRIEFKKKKGVWKVYYKVYLNEENGKLKINEQGEIERRGRNLSSILVEVGLNKRGNDEMKKLFSEKIFNYPKPSDLVKTLIQLSTKSSNDIILDFFAGSGTTGDAVMQLNVEDGGNRKYILVQIPEEIDKNKSAYDFVKNELKVETPTIFDIAKERLIRAGKTIKTEIIDNKIKEKQKEIKELEGKLNLENYKEKIKKIENEINDLQKKDLAFKIFQTIPNNEGNWENYILELEKFDPKQKLFNEDKLSNEDLKTLLTTWKTYDGIKLTQHLKEIGLEDYKGYYFDNKLYLVNKGFETKHLKKLLEEIDENKDFNPATIIVFGYNFESKILREIADNVKNYANKKQIDIDFIVRY